MSKMVLVRRLSAVEKRRLKELQSRMVRHGVLGDTAVVVLIAWELEWLIEIAKEHS